MSDRVYWTALTESSTSLSALRIAINGVDEIHSFAPCNQVIIAILGNNVSRVCQHPSLITPLGEKSGQRTLRSGAKAPARGAGRRVRGRSSESHHGFQSALPGIHCRKCVGEHLEPARTRS